MIILEGCGIGLGGFWEAVDTGGVGLGWCGLEAGWGDVGLGERLGWVIAG